MDEHDALPSFDDACELITMAKHLSIFVSYFGKKPMGYPFVVIPRYAFIETSLALQHLAMIFKLPLRKVFRATLKVARVNRVVMYSFMTIIFAINFPLLKWFLNHFIINRALLSFPLEQPI